MADLKVGVHLSMRNYPEAELLALLDAMHRAGRPCPVITLLGPDEIAPSRIRAVSPETMIILRVWRPGDDGASQTAAEYFRLYVDPYPERKIIRIHQRDNEDTDWSPNKLAWRKQQMAWTEQHGYREATPTPPTGYPDLMLWSQPNVWDFLRYIRDHAHILSLHEYDIGVGDWSLFRFIHRVLPLLPEDLRANMPKVVFTEFGVQKMRDMSDGAWLTTVAGYQAELAKYPFIIGASLWSLGDTGGATNPGENWQADNYAGKMRLLAEI